MHKTNELCRKYNEVEQRRKNYGTSQLQLQTSQTLITDNYWWEGKSCWAITTTATTRKPCYRSEQCTIPLYILIRIEFYNGIMQFLCHAVFTGG